MRTHDGDEAVAPAPAPAPPDPGRPDAEGLPLDRPRGVGRRILSGIGSYGVVLLIFWFLFEKLSASGDMGASISLITAPQVAVMLVLGLANLFTNLPPLVITLDGLRLREAGVTNTASAALSNTVPEGGAVATGLNFAMLRSWGFDLDHITSSFLTTGIWTNLVRYSLLAVALLDLATVGGAPVALIAVSLVVTVLVAGAIVLLIVILRSAGFSRWLGHLLGRLSRPFLRLFHKPPIDDVDQRVVDFRDQMRTMLHNRWHALTLAMLVSQLTACFVLGAAVRMQGFDNATISWSRIIAAFGVMSLASLVAPTPGGLGVAEVALVAVLGAGLPQSDQTAVTAAVLLFRLATWLEPIPIGAGSYLFWRRTTRWRMTEAERAASREPPSDLAVDGELATVDL
jgi:uncharacterized protein (TIRG00374 family)